MNKKLGGFLAGVLVLGLMVFVVSRRQAEPERAPSGTSSPPGEAAPPAVPSGADAVGLAAPSADVLTVGPANTSPAMPDPGGASPPAGIAPGAGAVSRPATPAGGSPLVDPPEEAGVPPSRPPMDAPPPGPPSLAAEMHHLMRKVAEGRGPPLDEHAQEMLVSEDPLMRAVGAAMMSASGPLSAEVLGLLAADAELQVPLMALGWLEDTGHNDEAVALAGLLRDQGVAAKDLSGLVSSGALDSIAARAALDLLRKELPADDLSFLLSETAIAMEQDHAVRMKALLLLRDTMPFEDYREEVKLIADATRGVDPLWDESVRREVSDLEGPVPVLDRPPQLSPSTIDEKLAREYPAMLDDLVLHVEYVLEHDEGLVAAGTADRLQDYHDQLSQRPWTDDQQFALSRMGWMISDVRALEAATHAQVVDDGLPPGMR